MFSTFLIALREGLEAALIIGILVAYLSRSGREKLLPILWLWVAGAIIFSLGLGAFLTFTSTQLSVKGEQIFAGTTSLLAVALVTWMVFWMKRSARGLKNTLENKVDDALPLGRVALGLAAFFAVAREGLETALFIYTNFKTVTKDTAPSVGLVLGLALAIILGYLIYRRAVAINLAKFFLITGIALLVVAAGVLSHGLHEFQEFGALPGGGAYAWHFNSADFAIVTLFDGTIGIGAEMTWLQLVLWAAYLGITLRSYVRPVKPIPAQQTTTSR